MVKLAIHRGIYSRLQDRWQHRQQGMTAKSVMKKMKDMDVSGYQLTIVYDMGSVGGKGVKTRTLQFDSEEDAIKEADNHNIGDWEDFEGVRTQIHDKMVTTTYTKNMPDYRTPLKTYT